MKFKGMVFDLDNTLYDEGLYFAAVFRDFCDLTSHGGKQAKMLRAYRQLRGQSKDILADVLESVGLSVDLKDTLFGILTSIVDRISPYGDAVDLLGTAKTCGLKLGLLTNGVIAVQRNKVRSLALASYFDGIVYARQCGREKEKPHQWAFEEIARVLQVPAKQLIFVGDNPNTDFKGAKDINGFTVRLKRGTYGDVPGGPLIDLEIGDMKELEVLL